MATYEKIANLKGPKGNGIGNPRIVGDNLVVDTFDGTEVAEQGKVVGNVRGPVGPKGPMPSLQVSAAAGGEDADPVARVTDTPTGYSVELLNTKGRTPKVGASVVTGAPGTEASVAVTDTDKGADFAFTVPRGDRGEVGPVGPKGPMPALRAAVPDNGGSPSAAPSVRVVDTEGGYALEFLDLKGPVGPVPRIEMQPPLNLAHGSTPTVSFYEASPGVYRLQLGLVQGEPGKASGAISDEATDYQTAWSSLFTKEQIEKAVDAIIDDGKIAALTGWSSEKIRAEIDRAVVKTLPWSSITGKPATFPPASHSHSWGSITGKPSAFPPDNHSHSWSEITGKPSTFTPASHTHSASQITSGVLSQSRLPNASSTGAGIVKLATSAEVEAGTSTSAVPSMADVASYVKTTAKAAVDEATQTSVGGPSFIGEQWDGVTPLKRHYVHTVIELSRNGTGNGSVAINAGFQRGIVYASVTVVDPSLIAVVRHGGSNPASTISRLEMHFKTIDGKNASGLVRLNVEVVGC